MNESYDLITISEKIRLLKKTIKELKSMSAGFPALERNAERISADVRVLELDIVDVLDILYSDSLPGNTPANSLNPGEAR